MEPLIEVTIPAPVGEVWAHLREPALIRRWFGWDYEGLAQEVDQIFLQEPAVDDAAHTLEWDHGVQHGDRFELIDAGAQTLLRMTRWVPTGQEGWDGIYDDIGEGWKTFVQQLRFAIARHRGEERRTLYLSSPAKDGGVLPIAATLDLGEAAAGERHRARGLSGEVWYRTEHQVGVTVDEHDGLLVAWEKPAAAKPPHGAAAMILTSYGQAPDEAGWRAWWAEHVGEPAS